MTSVINLDYEPRKFGKCMLCHSSVKEKRVTYINWYRALCEEAAAIYRDSKHKIAEMLLPPGIFAPGGYITTSLIYSPV